LAERIGLTLVDARPLTKHATDRFTFVSGGRCHADVEAWQIERMMMKGVSPHPRDIYDDELRGLVERAYERDIALFNVRFPQYGLFTRRDAAEQSAANADGMRVGRVL
jgi:hypothetical protein